MTVSRPKRYSIYGRGRREVIMKCHISKIYSVRDVFLDISLGDVSLRFII